MYCVTIIEDEKINYSFHAFQSWSCLVFTVRLSDEIRSFWSFCVDKKKLGWPECSVLELCTHNIFCCTRFCIGVELELTIRLSPFILPKSTSSPSLHPPQVYVIPHPSSPIPHPSSFIPHPSSSISHPSYPFLFQILWLIRKRFQMIKQW